MTVIAQQRLDVQCNFFTAFNSSFFGKNQSTPSSSQFQGCRKNYGLSFANPIYLHKIFLGQFTQGRKVIFCLTKEVLAQGQRLSGCGCRHKYGKHRKLEHYVQQMAEGGKISEYGNRTKGAELTCPASTS